MSSYVEGRSGQFAAASRACFRAGTVKPPREVDDCRQSPSSILPIVFRITTFEPVHVEGAVRLCVAEGWPSWTRESVLAAFCSPGVIAITALDGDEVIGVAELLTDGRVTAYLGLLVVERNSRGRGVGRALVEELFSRSGLSRMDLLSEDASTAFYESLPHKGKPGYRLYPPGFGEQTLPLSFPVEGLRFDSLVLRLPTLVDLRALATAFSAGELSEADNIPFRRDELATRLTPSPSLVRLVVADAESGVIFGGGTLHHFDPKRGVIEIGYWLLPRARGRGIATKVARTLAEFAFTLGVHRVAAYVQLGNVQSERVLERAGFTREGVIRSMPNSDGRRVDKTIFSLLPGE